MKIKKLENFLMMKYLGLIFQGNIKHVSVF